MGYNIDNVICERSNKTVYYDQESNSTIKLFVENYSKANILNEALNQVRVEESTDLKIGQLKEVTKINNRWALVSDHINGTSLEELMNNNPDKIDEYMDLFINIQLEVLSKRVPLLNRMKEKYRGRITNAKNIDDNTKYELIQRLEGIESHNKLCHGDFNPSNVIITESGEHFIIDWAHATQGNASGDAAMTYLIFSKQGRNDLAEKYINRFAELSHQDRQSIQRWIPIVAASQLTKGNPEEEEFLRRWIDVVEY